MAIRLKTVFFKNAGGRSTAETASVLASTIWRIADEVVTNLSKWDCDIVTPERGMKILGEMAAFLLHMADRMAYGRMPEPEDGEAFRIGLDNTIDISEAVRQYSEVAAEMQPLCRPDCPGICPVCGQDLTIGDCSCDRTPVDPRWAALAALKRSNG